MKIQIIVAIKTFLAISLFIVSSLSQAALKATVNKNTFTLNETIQLTLHGDSQTPFHNVNLSALNKDFEIIHRSSENRISVTNGQQQESVKLNLLMRANQHGRLMIPSISAGKEKTDAIQIQVYQVNAQASAAAQNQPVFLEMQWLNDEPTYVQAQMTLTLKIRHDGSLQQGQLDSPKIENAMVNTLGRDTSYQENIDGRTWQVIERRFAVTPLKSGKLTVPPLLFQGQVSKQHNSNRNANSYFKSFFGQAITLQTRTLTREILPPASTFTGTNWLPAKAITLSIADLEKNQYSVGDPINLKINVDAVGLLAEQLPGIKMGALPESISIYPDDPTLDNRSDKNNVMGKLSLDIVLIPSEVGDISLPEITVDWWNTETNQQQSSSLSLPKLTVLEATIASNNSSTASPTITNESEAITRNDQNTLKSEGILSPLSQNKNNPWMWATIVALCGWLGTLIWAIKYRSTATESNSNTPKLETLNHANLLHSIKQHALNNNGQETYVSLLKLCKNIWPTNTIEQLHQHLDSTKQASSSEHIKSLSQHLYRHSDQPWDGKVCWQTIEGALSELIKLNSSDDKSTLSIKPLYPSGST